MRRYYSDPATILVHFGEPSWKNSEECAGGEGGPVVGYAPVPSETASEQAGCRFYEQHARKADRIESRQVQLMSREGAHSTGTSKASTSRSGPAWLGADDEDFENEEDAHDDNKNMKSERGGILMKCMCSSVLLFTGFTALLLLLPLVLPSPLPSPPLELLLLPLLILLLLMCLALSSPSQSSSP